MAEEKKKQHSVSPKSVEALLANRYIGGRPRIGNEVRKARTLRLSDTEYEVILKAAKLMKHDEEKAMLVKSFINNL